MKTLRILCAAALGVVLGGCAQRDDRTLTAAPSTAELPTIPNVERTIPAHIMAAPSHRGSRIPLVADFADPELTPEEQAALGLDRPAYEFLKHDIVQQPLDSPIAPWRGGVSTATHGSGGVSVARDRPVSVSGMGSGIGGVAVGITTHGFRISEQFGPRGGVTTLGPTSTVEIEITPQDKRISERKPTIE